MKEILAFYHLQEALEEIGEEIVRLYKMRLEMPDIKGFNHIATSDLVNSVKFLVARDDREIWVELHLENYWDYLEHGTPPHWPPRDAILKWVKVRNILPRGVNTSLPRGGNLETYYKQSAYLISRHIAGVDKDNKKTGKGGTPAYMPLNKTMDALNDWITNKLEEAIKLDLEEDLDLTLIKYFK